MRIPIEKILSPDTDHRPVDGKFVGELAALIQSGAKTLPVTVFVDTEGRTFLADGYARTWAARRAGLQEVECTIISGTRQDAQNFRDAALRAQGRR
jgi:hypothetical protein